MVFEGLTGEQGIPLRLLGRGRSVQGCTQLPAVLVCGRALHCVEEPTSVQTKSLTFIHLLCVFSLLQASAPLSLSLLPLSLRRSCCCCRWLHHQA